MSKKYYSPLVVVISGVVLPIVVGKCEAVLGDSQTRHTSTFAASHFIKRSDVTLQLPYSGRRTLIFKIRDNTKYPRFHTTYIHRYFII